MVQGRSIATISVPATFTSLSLITVSLRCYMRLQVVKRFGWDDGLMVVAMILDLVFTITGVVGSIHGIGQKSEYFNNRPDDYRLAMLCWWTGLLFYTLASTLMRVSIALMLLRFTIDLVHSAVLYATIALSTIGCAVFFFISIFQCSPVRYYWDSLVIHGKCYHELLVRAMYFYSAVCALCDLTIGILPALMMQPLTISRRTKLGLIVILGLGGMLVLRAPDSYGLMEANRSSAIAAMIIRMPFLHLMMDSDEFLYSTTQVAIWSHIEVDLGIIAGSLTSLRPAFINRNEDRQAVNSLTSLNIVSRSSSKTHPADAC
ncbi:hypothetical protein BDV34DRAFT_230516 [Aspergillus parasiticus]|uniref:Rhodopsin domain-containing protein n=1 Tax=Aspergillus parasiticus TaxID=5067 RepID=A0A5N6D5J7_ASPPA|nr:hypothetical protein BDV34DRAFT_230516 [Aspergillus parasiticus]